MSYPFIRCRLRAVHPLDPRTDSIGLSLDRADEGEPLRVALLMKDRLHAGLAASAADMDSIRGVEKLLDGRQS